MIGVSCDSLGTIEQRVVLLTGKEAEMHLQLLTCMLSMIVQSILVVGVKKLRLAGQLFAPRLWRPPNGLGTSTCADSLSTGPQT